MMTRATAHKVARDSVRFLSNSCNIGSRICEQSPLSRLAHAHARVRDRPWIQRGAPPGRIHYASTMPGASLAAAVGSGTFPESINDEAPSPLTVHVYINFTQANVSSLVRRYSAASAAVGNDRRQLPR